MRGKDTSAARACRGAWRGLGGVASLVLVGMAFLGAASPPGPYSKEYAITVDPTALTPPTRWHVPGMTPIIATLDPESTDAYSTTERHVVELTPGQYRFGTFTFDFPFVVTLDGLVDYSSDLDQCVGGRGTRTLTVRCSQVQPHITGPDYYE